MKYVALWFAVSLGGGLAWCITCDLVRATSRRADQLDAWFSSINMDHRE